MIVIVANRWDRTVRAGVSRQEAYIGVLTARDLSTTGWRLRPGAGNRNVAIIEGRPVPQGEIAGVLTLLPCVSENELPEIAPEDRRYVAAEMTAFLLYWLSSLKCPVLNRPTDACLAGPGWSREKWVTVAAQAGIPVRTFRRSAIPGSAPEDETVPGATVMVAGKSVIGDTDLQLHLHARRLADLAGVDLLAVHFSNPGPNALFLTADGFPGLSDEKVAGAVLDYLRSGTS